MKKLFIITGEYSGDTHAAYVVDEIKKLSPSTTIEAIGGKNLKERGIKLFSDHSKMSGTGLTPKMIWDHFNLGKNLIKYLKEDYKPDTVLLIDYSGFNLQIAKALKGSGIKVYYYICPQLWATRKGRLKSIKKYVDKVFMTLPFEKKIYDGANIENQFVGHPLITQLPPKYDKNKFIEENDLDPNKKIVGIFPGSRKMELQYLLKTFIKAAEILDKKAPNQIQFCISQAPNIKTELLEKFFKKTDLKIKILQNKNHQLLSCSDSLILASGTVSLEAALYHTPMLISYRAPWLYYLIYLCIRYIKYVSLPNIILGKEVIKELIQHKSKPELIADETYDLIFNEDRKSVIADNLSLVKDMLSNKCSSQEVAKALLGDLNNETYSQKKTPQST
ncbi:MAG: lipid-A-disaccharide synthase [Candidatus Gastranaerophilales bacterium]|nr:lipid-A-disaccharide synthase [Candidatus Gastranaerophilales bacterium]